MKKARTIISIVSLSLLSASSFAPGAIAAPAMAGPSGLGLIELKMTGDEYILLQNNSTTTIPDLSVYWLTVFNNVSPLAAGVSSSSQQLPAVSLQSRQTLMLSSSPMQTCGASVAGKLSLSLNDGGGFLQLSKSALTADGAVSQTGGDFVSWSSGASGTIQNTPSNSKSPRAAYYRYFNGNSYVWQLADLDARDGCQLNIVVAGGPGSSSAVTPLTLAATSPPATIMGETGTEDGRPGPSLPAADIGLTAPQLSELLPNPNGTGNDKTGEFIELYNPNPKPFDLTGFTIDAGLTSIHEYTFPAGTVLEANAFRAFTPAETKLTLSNTGSQVSLLDPFANVISASDAYASAKDGISWANAQGKWQWTTQPTPGAANIIKAPAAKSKKALTKKKSTQRRSAIKTAATRPGAAASTSGNVEDTPAAGMVHTWVLALVAGAALLYGAYEYRRDLANRLFQLRAKLGLGRAAGKTAEGRRSD